MREILIHLNVKTPDDDAKTADLIADVITSILAESPKIAEWGLTEIAVGMAEEI